MKIKADRQKRGDKAAAQFSNVNEYCRPIEASQDRQFRPLVACCQVAVSGN